MGFGLGGPWWRLQFEGDAADTAGVQHASPEPSSNIRVWRERGRDSEVAGTSVIWAEGHHRSIQPGNKYLGRVYLMGIGYFNSKLLLCEFFNFWKLLSLNINRKTVGHLSLSAFF